MEARMKQEEPIRILVADDESLILKVYDKCFRYLDGANKRREKIASLENELFEEEVSQKPPKYDVVLCKQGLDAVEEVKKSIEEKNPFAIAFLDIRMPPGIDGVETGERIRALDPYVNIVFVTAYSDISPEEINRRILPVENLLYLQKPMHIHEIRQFAASLSAKWIFERAFRSMNRQLAGKLNEKTQSLNKTTVELTMEKIGHVKAEAAAEESEQKFQNVVESSPLAIHLYALNAMWELNLIQANSSADALFGMDHSRHIGETIDVLIPAIVDAKLKKQIQLVAKRGKPLQLEKTVNGLNGTEKILDIIVFQTSNRKLAMMFSDITERKHYEIKLKEKKEHLSLITNQLPAMIAHTGLDMKFLFVNDAYAEFYGETTNDIIGKTVEEVLGKRAYENAAPYVEQVLNGETVTYEKKTVNIAGKSFHLFIVLTPDVDENGVVRGYFSFLRDITDMKKSEKEKQELRDQLLQSQKMEAIGKLAGGIAHDFNNVLAGISGCATLAAEEDGVNESAKRLMEEIVSITKRGADLTRKLLAFSRRQVIEPKEVDVNLFIDEIVSLLKRLIGRGVKLTTDTTPGTSLIKVDPGHLTQVLMNLTVNARDAMEGSGNLSIETSQVALDEDYCKCVHGLKAGQYVMIAVSDTGCGIEKETLEHIFEPFFTTKPKDKGTGLGLSTVYGIVKQNKGEIDVYSKIGMGTTFKIYFPIIEGQTQKQTEIQNENKVDKRKILIVDDDPMVREMTSKVIRRLGYATYEAGNATEAKDILERMKDKIDLMLTDVVMPDTDGKELADDLHGIYPDLNVLFTSGYTTHAIMQNGVLTEDVNYIAKPYTPKMLDAKIKQALGDSENKIN